MINYSRRRFIKNSAFGVGTSAGMLALTEYSFLDTKDNTGMLDSELFISKKWAELHSKSPQQYMLDRKKSDNIGLDFRGFIDDDFQTNNICFVGGITMSVFEFALLAAKHTRKL